MSEALAPFGWRDVVDILLVAVVVYRVAATFRGTRTVQLLVGVAALVVASLAARRLEMRSVQWLLDNFWSFWAVALIVLFQPELRRAVERIGQGRVFHGILGGFRAERARVVDHVVAMTQSLVARRIGALVVIERSGGLRPYADLGVPLDALVSAELREALFVPPSPLHDGAVLVRCARLAAAGCFLPLSRNAAVGRQLGSRRRAALGITEETDAIAVVVSEETGRVSLAVEGIIEAVADPVDLSRRLNALIGGPTDAQPSSFWSGVRRTLRAPDRA
ncbi:MAG: TIGR00159 family protein [Candidatus Rokubacteria bacterium]|nr:TIGR00159 family protein [Candidatus Rokubacteria bacterium]